MTHLTPTITNAQCKLLERVLGGTWGYDAKTDTYGMHTSHERGQAVVDALGSQGIGCSTGYDAGVSIILDQAQAQQVFHLSTSQRVEVATQINEATKATLVD